MLHNCTTYKSGRYVDRLQHVVKTSFSCGFAELAGLKFLANILFWEFEYLQSLLQHASEDLYGMQGQDLWWLQYIFYSGAVNEAANVAGCNSKRHSLISFSLKWLHARILHIDILKRFCQWLLQQLEACTGRHFVVALSAFSTELQQEL